MPSLNRDQPIASATQDTCTYAYRLLSKTVKAHSLLTHVYSNVLSGKYLRQLAVKVLRSIFITSEQRRGLPDRTFDYTRVSRLFAFTVLLCTRFSSSVTTLINFRPTINVLILSFIALTYYRVRILNIFIFPA